MDKHGLVQIIEEFAPLEFAEKWDCSGWLVETSKKEVKKIMLALTVTKEVINQALEAECDMIISHHPLFSINCGSELNSQTLQPLIDIYCAHTNLDKADGGTTDTLINELGVSDLKINCDSQFDINFLRYIDLKNPFVVGDFVKLLSKIFPNLRYVNNKNVKTIQKIAFCSGSGSDFIKEAQENCADALVTGDIKFHTALDSEILLFDIGHFESEILVLQVFAQLLKDKVKIVFAEEKSPFESLKMEC